MMKKKNVTIFLQQSRLLLLLISLLTLTHYAHIYTHSHSLYFECLQICFERFKLFIIFWRLGSFHQVAFCIKHSSSQISFRTLVVSSSSASSDAYGGCEVFFYCLQQRVSSILVAEHAYIIGNNHFQWSHYWYIVCHKREERKQMVLSFFLMGTEYIYFMPLFARIYLVALLFLFVLFATSV